MQACKGFALPCPTLSPNTSSEHRMEVERLVKLVQQQHWQDVNSSPLQYVPSTPISTIIIEGVTERVTMQALHVHLQGECER